MSSNNNNKRLESLVIPHTDTERVIGAVLSPVPDFMGVMLVDLPARVYNLRTGQLVDVPVTKPVRDMAFRPRTAEFPCNELAIVTGDYASSVKRLDLELQIGLIEVFMPRANAVVYSHCGRFMAAGSTDGTVRIWNLQNQDAAPEEIFCQKVSRHGVTRLAFNPTNDVLFIVTARGELLHVNTGNADQPAHPYLLGNDGNAFPWDCYCVATHPVAKLVAFGGVGSDVILSSIDSRKVFTLKTNVGEFVRHIEFIPDSGQLLVVGREVEVFNLSPLASAPAAYATPTTGRPLCAKQYGGTVFVVRA
jgi:WD40 repeat protein